MPVEARRHGDFPAPFDKLRGLIHRRAEPWHEPVECRSKRADAGVASADEGFTTRPTPAFGWRLTKADPPGE
ncbi:MAG: hypothetical protein Kow0047_30990 [Anaerolineae bacterium]